MSKRLHAADDYARAQIARAVYFTATLRVDRVPITHELRTLAMAREAARLLTDIHKDATSARALVYAVTPEGWSFMVPDDYDVPATASQGDPTMQLTTIACATVQGPTLPKLTPEPKIDAFVSRVFSDRSNCNKAKIKHAEKEQLDVNRFEVVPIGQHMSELAAREGRKLHGDEIGSGNGFVFRVRAEYARPAGLDGDELPDFLARTKGMTAEQIAEQRAKITKKHDERNIRMPKSRIKNPGDGRKATGLGMAPTQLKQTGAKTKDETAKAGSARKPTAAGDRVRYDWAGAEVKARAGTIPPAPDYSAPTHKYYKEHMANVAALARAGDVDGLKKIKFERTTGSPGGVLKYRDLCLVALKAKAAKA